MSFRNSYRCDAGHETSAPSHLKLSKCPVCVMGKPCDAPLQHVGLGSRAKNRALAESESS